MDRRNFLKGLAGVAAGFVTVPAAARIVMPETKLILSSAYGKMLTINGAYGKMHDVIPQRAVAIDRDSTIDEVFQEMYRKEVINLFENHQAVLRGKHGPR